MKLLPEPNLGRYRSDTVQHTTSWFQAVQGGSVSSDVRAFDPTRFRWAQGCYENPPRPHSNEFSISVTALFCLAWVRRTLRFLDKGVPMRRQYLLNIRRGSAIRQARAALDSNTSNISLLRALLVDLQEGVVRDELIRRIAHLEAEEEALALTNRRRAGL